jgi:PST family polysaccharide transporter
LWRVSAFIPMAVTSAVMMPLLQVLVRDMLAEQAGMASVGLVQGIWRLSDIYLGIITSTLSMYYLPRFAEIKGTRELRGEFIRALAIIVPLVAVFSGAIYLLRDFIIQVVFTEKFLPMSALFGWMMVGNVLKMTSWIFGYLIVSRGSPFMVIATELIFFCSFLVLAHQLVPPLGAVGLVIAYATSYAIHLIANVFFVSKLAGFIRPAGRGNS